MNILAIETSCDETGISIVEVKEGVHPEFTVLGNALYSQVKLHTEYGGVYPNLAKREHVKNLTPLLEHALKESGLYTSKIQNYGSQSYEKMQQTLSREHGLYEAIQPLVSCIEKPDVDLIAVTVGPGLAPALWVGVSFAKALGELWNLPVVPVNHMEGHIVSALMQHASVQFPALALLISGGHTELVSVKKIGSYKKIGETRDDAVGEAFDKVARMLHLPYPGGPEVSKRAQEARDRNIAQEIILPRPMIHSGDFDFSFSGLKTAVLYTLKEYPTLTEDLVLDVCRAFEDAATEVLYTKTKQALETYGTHTLIVAGGVIANTHIRNTFERLAKEVGVILYIPPKELATDNAIMIAGAGYYAWNTRNTNGWLPLVANGNLSL